MATREMEDGYLSDSDVQSSVAEILDNVAKPPIMISEHDGDLYGQLVLMLIPVEKNLDEEILFVTALKALSGAVYKINNIFHVSLLRNIFSIYIWDYGLDARNAILELITNLAIVPDKFLEDCLEMLVRNFQPPGRIRGYIYQPKFHAHKQSIYVQLHEALCYITSLVPIAPFKLKNILDRRMPKVHAEKMEMLPFVECMLGLESNEIGDYLRSTLLSMVIELLIDLDVSITWGHILKEDDNKDIFDIEVEDFHNAEYNSVGVTGGKKDNNADKLDCLMVIVCEHIKSSACDGRLVKVFDILLESFRKTVLNAYRSKFSQFIMFYACSLEPEVCGLKFAIFLTDIFVSKAEDPISRMSSVCYLASYLSRARFISYSVVSSIVKRLADWCYEYCHLHACSERMNHPISHRLFYAGFQAVMYILCFRMQSLMDIPELKAVLLHLPLEAILCHPLDPLKICLPTIVKEFLSQATAAHLLKKPLISCLQENLLESEMSEAFGGAERLHMFFPFDPYLLKESDRFIKPNYESWSMVRKTYTNLNSEEELDDLDSLSADDASEDGRDDGEFAGGDDDEDELEYSINQMSITPRPVFEIAMADGHVPIPSRMPARIRPSVSPV